ncbi:MAG: aryl-sulfate sulfotransferase, partial [bacterium]
MIETTNGIDTRGQSGYVEFWIWTGGLSGTNGWSFQLNAGSGYLTRLSELTGSNHAWQQYHYDLQAGELVASLKMRFQFKGSVQGNRVQLDDIAVKTTSASSAVQVPMVDDGLHQDGAAADGVYGAQIPAFPAGATVHYFVTALDNQANQATDPAAAPAETYSYTVAVPPVSQTVGLFTNLSGAYQGYTLLAPMHYTRTYLIDNAGKVVHTWDSAYEPGRTAYLLENGHLWRACMVKGGVSTGGGEGGRIEEFDWEGNLVWEFDYYSDSHMAHHDFKVLPNGNIIVLVVEKKTYAEVVAAGFNPALLDPEIASDGYMLPDAVIEVQPTRPAGGNIIWEWHVWDHLIQNFDASKNNYGVVANHPELIDVNGPGIKIPQFWNHMNTISYNSALDQIMMSARGNSEAWVIDHQTSTSQAAGHAGGRYNKGGDLLYRWGNPQQYNTGTAANQMFFQQHDTEWIPSGRPGAGNILIFNNGIGRDYSTVDEITPPVDAAGNYSRTSGTAYGPAALAWTYRAPNPADFYSAEISGAQRLPNGNTLICEGLKGNLFEVTTTGLTVWRYMCPVTDAGPMTQGNSIPADPRGGFMNAVFQSDRYAPDYPGLVGRDLTPRGPIELPAEPAAVTDWELYQTAPAADGGL